MIQQSLLDASLEEWQDKPDQIILPLMRETARCRPT